MMPLSVNDRVDIPSRSLSNCGCVRYLGKVRFADEDDEDWVGIELDEPQGNTDGSIDVCDGLKLCVYFICIVDIVHESLDTCRGIAISNALPTMDCLCQWIW